MMKNYTDVAATIANHVKTMAEEGLVSTTVDAIAENLKDKYVRENNAYLKNILSVPLSDIIVVAANKESLCGKAIIYLMDDGHGDIKRVTVFIDAGVIVSYSHAKSKEAKRAIVCLIEDKDRDVLYAHSKLLTMLQESKPCEL